MTELSDLTRWSSLVEQISLAEHLFGQRGSTMVRDWLAEEIGHIDDSAFAKLFTDHISLPGVAGADYAHRHIRYGQAELIGGIRFFAQDIKRPFVEVIAHSFFDAAPSHEDLEALRECVRGEWSMFAPLDVRLRVAPGQINHPMRRTDVTIHVARYRDMMQNDGRVQLKPFDDVAEAIEIVHSRYEYVAEHTPELARNISAAEADDLRMWHEADQLRAMIAEGETVGLLAIAPGSVAWLEGDEINEEVVVAAHSGREYAASAQAAWAATIAPDQSCVLAGTIDRLNTASRRSAKRAGRPAVLEEVFLRLSE